MKVIKNPITRAVFENIRQNFRRFLGFSKPKKQCQECPFEEACDQLIQDSNGACKSLCTYILFEDEDSQKNLIQPVLQGS
jgi:hypothetical protein